MKYRERSKFSGKGKDRVYEGKEETPVADVLNTLSKMAQKRAYVGAVIIAAGASDFFTQDLDERDDLRGQNQTGTVAAPPPAQSAPSDLGSYVVNFGAKYKGRTLADIGKEEVMRFRSFLMDSAARDKKPLGGAVKEFVEIAGRWTG